MVSLEYESQTRFPRRRYRWVLALSLYPWLSLLVLHAVLLVEWTVNGGPPNPTHHGAHSLVESFVCNAAGALLILTLPVALMHLVLLAWVAGDERCPIENEVMLIIVPMLSWTIGLLMFRVDPFQALSFFID